MRAATGLYIYIRCLHTYSGLPQAIGKLHSTYLFLFSYLFSPYGPCFDLAPIAMLTLPAMPTFRVVPIVKITEGALHVPMQSCENPGPISKLLFCIKSVYRMQNVAGNPMVVTLGN